MTYFDMKVAVFVNKIANCRKCATVRASARQVGWPDFWKILAGLVHLMEASASSQMQHGPQSLGPAADGAAGG